MRIVVAYSVFHIDLEPAAISAIIAAIAAIVAALSAFTSYRRDRLNQRLAGAKWQLEYFANLRNWSDETLLLLSESLHLCDLDPQQCEKGKFFEARHLLRIRLSAQIDRGRWIFPNNRGEDYGQHKASAYRGYRPAVLDALVAAYRAVSSLDYLDGSKNTVLRKDLKSAKVKFTSEIQEALDPRRRDEEFRTLNASLLHYQRPGPSAHV